MAKVICPSCETIIEKVGATGGDTCPICRGILEKFYIDDFPLNMGEEWEELMENQGHNVTSHLNETGSCGACSARRIHNEQD